MNEKEFELIVRDTKAVVLTAIQKNLNSEFYHSIDDVAQETYLRAYRGLMQNKFRGESTLSTWLYAIARNEARRMNEKLIREERKSRKKAERIEDEKMNLPEYSEEDLSIMNDAIKELPDKYRGVLELSAEGLSVEEISKKLEIRSGTVKSRAFRGRNMLKVIMGGYSNEQ